MTAEGAAVEHQSGEAFRAGINRGRQARGPGADDDDVIDAIGIDRPDQADATGKLVLAGIAQQLAARAQHDRQLAGVDMEALDQRFRLRVGHRVQCLMWMTIAAEKVFQPKHIAALGPADDHRAAGAGLEQADAAQDQGAHDPLAELRLRDQQGAQPIRRNDQGLHRPARAGVHQGGVTRQLRQFTQKCAGAMGDDDRAAAGPVVLGDLDFAGEDDAQPMADVADAG